MKLLKFEAVITVYLALAGTGCVPEVPLLEQRAASPV